MGKTTKAKAKATPTTMDLAARVSERVEIRHVRLVETLAKRKQPRGKLPERLNSDITVSTTTDADKLTIVVHPRFTLVGRFADDSSDEEGLRIEATYAAEYTVPTMEGLSEEDFKAFGELNGIYNVWPYWREYVQSLTTRMGFPPLTLPVLRPVQTSLHSPAAK